MLKLVLLAILNTLPACCVWGPQVLGMELSMKALGSVLNTCTRTHTHSHTQWLPQLITLKELDKVN